MNVLLLKTIQLVLKTTQRTKGFAVFAERKGEVYNVSLTLTPTLTLTLTLTLNPNPNPKP